MKTYNGKNITKRQIQSILRTEDATQIFRLYHRIFGGKVDKWDVYMFICNYAPSNRLKKHAYDIAMLSGIKLLPSGERYPREFRYHREFCETNGKHIALTALRNEIKKGLSSYTKRPMMGYTHLYFCSPVYGHGDYNKWRSIKIEGNERFCELICKLADKYFPRRDI